MMNAMARLNSVASVVPPNRIDLAETIRFISERAPDAAKTRLRRSLEESGNRTRHTVLPLDQLARLQGATERGALYRRFATDLGERAVARLADLRVLDAGTITTIVFVSSTGWSAPSIDTHLVRRFGLDAQCRRIPLTQLGCAGGVAALALAAEIVARAPHERVLVVSAEIPSLQLHLFEPSYWELMSAAQFADGGAAAIVSTDTKGPSVLGTRSVLLPESDEGGEILQCETGFRLRATSGLPQLIRSRVRDLVTRFTADCSVDLDACSFVLAHPRGRAVLDAVRDGLAIDPVALDAAYTVWEHGGNMVSASVYRAFAHIAESGRRSEGDVGMFLAFGTGVACEMVLLRWDSTPDVALS
jgi:alkylresorcinol/alkylpyrone synthase